MEKNSVLEKVERKTFTVHNVLLLAKDRKATEINRSTVVVPNICYKKNALKDRVVRILVNSSDVFSFVFTIIFE